MTRISSGDFFINREKASTISAVRSTLVIFNTAFLTEHGLLPNLVDVTKVKKREEKVVRPNFFLGPEP
jgi:hypothetical protein